MSDRYQGRRNFQNRENRGYFSKQHRGNTFKKYNKGKTYLRLDDHGDIDMSNDAGGSSQSGRFNPIGRGGNKGYMRGGRKGPSRVPKGKYANSTWVKVMIPFSKKMDKSFLLKSLLELSPNPFSPINFHHESNASIFYVNDVKTGLSLSRLSKQIRTPDDYTLKIITMPSMEPTIQLDDDISEKIKVAMSNRYDTSTGMLNLSKFHDDASLKAQGIYAPLHRYQVFSNVVKIIQENIPNLKAIVLSNNKLTALCALIPLFKKNENIVEVDLSCNSLKTVAELDKIQNSNTMKLVLDKNPLCNAFKDRKAYISTVRRRFPKVVNLDGQDLPPQIGFEIEKEIKLPSSQGSFFPNDECKSIILAFLDQYFKVFDSDDRQALLQAYSDNSIMSLTANRSRDGQIFEYQRESRNLMRVADEEKRKKLLRQGRLSVVSFLCELPKTFHDRNSFVVDVSFMSPKLISFAVMGYFKEFEKELDKPHRSPIRYFNRTFVVVPQGSGICVINEMFSIFNPTPEQLKVAFKNPAPTPSPSPVPAPSTLPTPAQAIDPKQQMIVLFSENSGMNLDFSSKCLVENEWNFDKAAHTFLELKKRGVIPPEAFIK